MTLHYKKDGTLDMRFNSSRAAVSSGFGMSSFRYSEDVSYSPMPAELHYKKDRTLDMRYNSSKALATLCHVSRPATSSQLHYKKDSTLDMRYTSSKNVMTSSKSGYTYSGHDIPRNIPVTKAGIPDMRTTAAKEWVKEQARMGMNDIPSWIPRTKDNSLDLTKAVTQEYLKCKDKTSTNYVSDQRLAYYCQKLEDMLFRKLIEDARREHVDMPEYEILPETNEIQRQLSSRSIRSSIRYEDDDYDICSEIPESVTLINYRDLKINSEDKLGQGSFGIVYKGIWKNQTVAVKQLHLNKLTRQENNPFVKEIKIMSKLGKHPNLVYLHGYTLDPLCLVMEYVELGSLNYLLHYCEDSEIEAKITDGRIKKKLILGIILGMIQLHAVNIVHGDLKPQNVLVSRDYTAKVTDFGLATLRAKTSSSIASSMTSDDGATICGTAGYMAPELLSSTKPPEYSSDVYSFGILLNEVIHEEEPYSDQYLNFAGREAFGAANYAQSGKRPNIKLGTPPCLKNLIEKCWHAYAQGRPSFKQIYQDLKPDHIKFPNSIDL
ncbi:unnamed protein product [Rotaria sordida]|uniref:Protein kinase domain-containing protein n=1 Tax=Rotaria sordida TaxID=392033 RepID=A0A814VQY2_9BILA|nr:unnamed protein product [Rotaria sordida]CAF4162080.1 unnamed protein product [Rotaria sordida]